MTTVPMDAERDRQSASPLSPDCSESDWLDTDGATALSDDCLATDLQSEEVEVCAERLDGRQRQITAKIRIPHSVDRIWQILTDYDRLAEFIPSLTQSQRIPHPENGIRIEQVGAESLMKLKFCARVVLDMVEQCPHRLDFTMVEGDFKRFQGSWHLQPIASEAGGGTELCYTVTILPPRVMPIALIERRLKSGLVLNLFAIRQRADELFASPSGG